MTDDHFLFDCRIANNKMENIIQNPGFQHIVEKVLIDLNKKSIIEFRSVNSDCRRITDSPRFYLKKLSNQSLSKNFMEKWEVVMKNIPTEDIKKCLTKELFKMYVKGYAKEPLELAQDLAIGKKVEDIGLVTCIIGNSSPKSFVVAKIDYLLSHGISCTVTPLHLSAYFGFEEAVRSLISSSAIPTVPNETGYTPIHFAACKGHLEVVRLLMNSTENPFVKNYSGSTPIHLASGNGHLEVVRLLMTKIDNPIIQNIYGDTPIHKAARYGHLEVVRLLMTKTDNPIVQDKDGETPIHKAARNGHLEIIRLLMTSTDNPIVHNYLGNTPIHEAARHGHLEVVRLLMTATANPNIPNDNGRTPESLAATCKHHDIVKLFRKSKFLKYISWWS